MGGHIAPPSTERTQPDRASRSERDSRRSTPLIQEPPTLTLPHKWGGDQIALTERTQQTPASGKIAVKVTNNYGDEALKVIDV